MTLQDVPVRDDSKRDDQYFYKGVDVYGGYSVSDADNRTIQGNSIELQNTSGQFDHVYGGKSTTGKVQNNSVTITGDVYQVWGGQSWDNDASDNRVTLKDSKGTTPNENTQVIGGAGITGQRNVVTIENSTVHNVLAFSGDFTFFDQYEGNEEKVGKNAVILFGNVTVGEAVVGSY